jgi:alkanesulfonate monooxygenase SsuD/methylene tetrahydromethanopterin reductase-like flavin-dependent oxidoreductase (luciferase family)
MVGVNVVAAETDAEARRLFTSVQQSFAKMVRGTRGKLPPPIDDIELIGRRWRRRMPGYAVLLGGRLSGDGAAGGCGAG